MGRFSSWKFVLLAGPALLWAQTSPNPLPLSAALSFIQGTVEVKRAAGGEWGPIALNDSLSEGDQLRTGEASEAEVALSGGSTLKLREGTELELSGLKLKGAVKQVKGSLFMILKSVFTKDNPFLITTPTATASIHGTAFAVRLKEGQSFFAVVQGKIGVKGSAGEEVAVAAGSFSTVAAGAAAGAAQAIPADALKNLETWSGVAFEAYQETAEPVSSVSNGAPGNGAPGNGTPGNGAPGNGTPGNGTPGNGADSSGNGAPGNGPAAEKAADKGGDKISWSLGMGSATVDGKQWSRLSLRPDIPIGNFGIGLDLEVFIDDQGEISNKGWNFDNATQAFESLQRKIYYLRYGHPGDKFFARVGALDNVTLGYGLIMDGYSNALQYPDVKKTGLNFELNDISSLGVGVQGMVNNFQDFQREGALVGLRASVKPIKFLGLPIIQNLSVGALYVSDMNQRAALGDRDGDKVPDLLDKEPGDRQWAIVKPDYSDRDTLGNPVLASAVRTFLADDSAKNVQRVAKFRDYIEGQDPFSMVGADVGLPILQTKLLSVLTYGQIAFVLDDSSKYDAQKTEGWGFSFPGVRVGVGPLTVSLEYRHYQDQFFGGYFDQSYELHRMEQENDSTISSKEENDLAGLDSISMNGIFGRASLNIANLLMVGASYQYMTVTDNHDSANAATPSSSQEMTGTASVGETIRNILRKVKVEDVNAYFTKKNIGTWVVDLDSKGQPVYDAFFEASPSILMGYKVGFQMGANMVLYWDNQYTYMIDEESTGIVPELKLTQRRNIEAVLKF